VPELRFISQPKGVPVSNTLDYIWVDGGGRDVNVYVIDSGAYTGNSEFYNMPGGKRWLKSTLTNFPLQLEETDEDGHGSCVISKVSGPRLGVAKNANITVVKFAAEHDGRIWFSSLLDSLYLVCRDVVAGGLQGKAVVNLSWGIPLDENDVNDRESINALHALIDSLLGNDVVVVVASGNLGVSHLLILCSLDECKKRYNIAFIELAVSYRRLQNTIS
jgi:subtilisin family serine protease